jgi:hypothetical protein
MLLVSPRLELFKDLGNDIYNFRCPFCGDSKRKKNKARGYFFPVDDTVIFKCHNCGKSISLPKFLQELDYGLFTQYKLEKFGKPKQSDPLPELVSVKQKEFVSKTNDVLRECYKLSDVPEDLKSVLEYAKSRCIPEVFFEKLYAARSLNSIAKRIDRYKDKEFSDFPVLVIPFFRADGSYSYIQCRSIDSEIPQHLRFVTFGIDTSAPKLWGEFRVNWNKPIYILEGPIDAMFVVNGLAIAGAMHTGTIDYVKECQVKFRNELNLKDICFCYDNDYSANQDIMKQLLKRIDEGFSVVIYDKKFKFKDINDAIRGGWNIQEINTYIRSRTFSGLTAKLELSKLGRS